MPWILHRSIYAQNMGTLVRCFPSPVALDLINARRYRAGLPKLAAWTWTEIQITEIVVHDAIIRGRRLSATYSAGEEILITMRYSSPLAIPHRPSSTATCSFRLFMDPLTLR